MVNEMINNNLKQFGLKTENSTYIIAEIGINHSGKVDVAKKLIDSAAKTGCDAVKFQTYITEKRAPNADQNVKDLLKKCELPFNDFAILKKHSEEQDLQFFSTPFDDESVDYLETINTHLYKIASFDVENKKFLTKMAKTNKPILMSVGMVDLNKIQLAYELITHFNKKLAILHCVSSYPTKEIQANLGILNILKDQFSDCVIGHSDHTIGIKVPLYAVAMGARILEKHYKIDEDMDCVDKTVSISEDQMKKLVKEVRSLEKIIGDYQKIIIDDEKSSLQFKRYS